MRLTQKQIIVAIEAHFSAKLNGKVQAWAENGAYYISASGLPAHPRVAHLYPNGWSMGDTVTVEEALDIAEAHYELSRPKIVRLSEAIALLDSAEAYMYQRTYNSDGAGSKTWSQWYHDVLCTVTILREANREAREELARLIGAKLDLSCSQNVRR